MSTRQGRRPLQAAAFVALSGLLLATGCRHMARVQRPPPAAPEMLAPSPRLMVGRVVAVDAADRMAFVELATDAPAEAVADGSALVARTLELRETGRLQASRYVRGRTLGAKILGGQPAVGDEVVWLAP